MYHKTKTRRGGIVSGVVVGCVGCAVTMSAEIKKDWLVY